MSVETPTDAGRGSVASADETIRPFHVEVSEEELDDLRRRIVAT
jgi:hypothetical protein